MKACLFRTNVLLSEYIQLFYGNQQNEKSTQVWGNLSFDLLIDQLFLSVLIYCTDMSVLRKLILPEASLF